MSLAHADHGVSEQFFTADKNSSARSVRSSSTNVQDSGLASDLQEQIRDLFALDDDSDAEVGRRLSGLGSRSTNRNEQFESALSFVVGPAASPIVRRRIDNGEHEFLLTEHGGHLSRIITPLGARPGGFGNVYLVRDPDLSLEHPDHVQVVKQLRKVQVSPKLKSSGDWNAASGEKDLDLVRFNKEADFAQRLTESGLTAIAPRYLGRGIRTIETVEETTDEAGEKVERKNVERYPLIRFGFKHGLSLEEFRAGIPEGEALPLSLFSDLAAHICASVHLMHRDGELIHRDLKPGNLFLKADGTGVMVIDFGLARDKNADDAEGNALLTRATAENSTLGTGKYMAPEQLGGAERVAEPADWYGTFLSLYQLLTGRHVYDDAPDGTPLLRAIQYHEPVEALARLKSIGLPADTVDLFRRGFAKKEEERPLAREIITAFLKLREKEKPKSGEAVTFDAFLDRVKAGKEDLSLPKKHRAKVTSTEAPLPSGYPSLNDDKGAHEMYAALRLSHTERTRGNIGKLLWPAVALGVTAVAAGSYAFAHRNDGLQDGTIPAVEPVGTDVIPQTVTQTSQQSSVPAASAQAQAVEPSVAESTSTAGKSPENNQSNSVLPISSHFQGTADENGKLTKITLFPGTSREIELKNFTTFTRGGIVHMVHSNVELKDIAKYLGMSVEELPIQPDYREAGLVPLILIFKPGSDEFVLSPLPNTWVSGSNRKNHVYSTIVSAAFQDSLGQNTVQSSATGFRFDQPALGVLETLPSSNEFDDVTPIHEQIMVTPDNWKKGCRNAQQQKK